MMTPAIISLTRLEMPEGKDPLFASKHEGFKNLSLTDFKVNVVDHASAVFEETLHFNKAILMTTWPLLFKDVLEIEKHCVPLSAAHTTWRPVLNLQGICSKSALRMILEFVHLSKIDSPLGMDCFIEVFQLATQYPVDSLISYCLEVLNINLSENTVWLFLNSMLTKTEMENSVVARKCAKVLCENTLRCLEHPLAMKASEKSIIFMLQQEELSVSSEKQLIDFCAKWAKQFPSSRKVMRGLLPHLRVLTLKPAEVAGLPDFLTKTEQLAILVDLINGSGAAESSSCFGQRRPALPDTVCATAMPRSHGGMTFMPFLLPTMISIAPHLIPPILRFSSPDQKTFTNVVKISVKESVNLSQVCILSAITGFAKVNIMELDLNRLGEVVYPTSADYTANLKVEVSWPGTNNFVQTMDIEQCHFRRNIGANVDLKEQIALKAGDECQLKVVMTTDEPPLVLQNFPKSRFTVAVDRVANCPFEQIEFSSEEKDPIFFCGVFYQRPKPLLRY
ncbi:uncharacterized protein LOC132196991 [Neocloeon triangulifer]|uniref:uncharacterized protein LOC132196991 n=1 Tax=Neocloeon triangulifer TaxID=2078957 RepID=UPI00286F4551|nr:uncharacterized protein LOC132196991 [Neocloeon triangulifer]